LYYATYSVSRLF